ncbi:unnamed protein product [Sympodiomycopsis kandeliae]
MDAIEKEVQKVANKVPSLYPSQTHASSSSSSSKRSSKKAAASASTATSSASVAESIDELLNELHTVRTSLVVQDGESSLDSQTPAYISEQLKSALDKSQKSIADRHKEVYNALSKLGKSYDKKFPTPVDGISDPSLFMGAEAQKALEAVVLDHMLRLGEWDAARQLAKDSSLPLPPSDIYRQLESISQALEAGFLQPAIGWAEANRHFLSEHSSDLEFALHRSQFLRIATGTVMAMADQDTAHLAIQGPDPDGEHVPSSKPSATSPCPRDRAIAYGRKHFKQHLSTHLTQIQALFTFALFPCFTLPIDPNADMVSQAQHNQTLRLQVHPAYYDFLDDKQMHTPYLVPVFRAQFTALHGLAKDAPLSTAVEVGASGALTKIMKVRQVMKMKGNEWSQADELPIDIPLPSHLRFHSTFTCPVSKEQATEENPPMMMTCGHVVCAESLARLGRGQGRVKCPYCPTESTVQQAMRIYF